ncbi:MAG: tRNA (N6-isopentenyl adenosine(37)-C2)-methylthiotransferase MiaB [Bacteroidetes bacterium SW_11_45_7]|nr:MAG: tRNA (N6-isopentenyl adenosine(37)-C2)-methylthiotransferase MiaB [Bacteroidetes bacterium SW_11_45_7]
MSQSQSVLHLQDQTIDANKQGEALSEDLVQSKKGQDSGKKYYIETYGCQMNFNDSEIVASILAGEGFSATQSSEEADLLLINTCSIRENAEQRVRQRLKQLQPIKKQKPEAQIGVLGCMAERLKSKFLEEEKLVDLVVGPDAYRDIPSLVREAETGDKGVNVLLSREETYADINPVRLDSNGVSAFISIMRGCDNMCSFCVVPFTRGRERSRNPESIVAEAQYLVDHGYKEVTLLGQNVDSYLWFGGGPKKEYKNLTDEEKTQSVDFAGLLEKAAKVSPDLRVRFSTSHPKDITEDVMHVMNKYDNICKYIHLPVQSGNTRILNLMNRGYSREWYLDKVAKIKEIIPDCGISSDIISGFCDETEEEHQDTLSLMEKVRYDMAYMFNYSERPGTLAAKKYTDNVDKDTKKRRLQEIISLQHQHGYESNLQDIGKTFTVLVEGYSKKSNEQMRGRNSQNKMIVFPQHDFQPGDYVDVKVDECTSATLIGHAV